MGALALLLRLPNANALAGPNIVAVRVWPADDYTRVTIESDQPLAAKHQLVEAPDRLVIDINGLELSPGLRELLGKVKADDPFIGGVRVGQNTPTVVRLVLDLKQAALPQVFNLPPVAAYQHRLVLDVYPTQSADPLSSVKVNATKTLSVEASGASSLRYRGQPSVKSDVSGASSVKSE